MVHSYLPRLVELHNYSAANSVTQKEYNWTTLNDKVFRRFGFHLASDDIEQIVRARPGIIERTLLNMRTKLENAKAGKRNSRGGGSKSAGSKRSNRNDRQRRGGDQRQTSVPVREPRQLNQNRRQQQPQQSSHRQQQQSQRQRQPQQFQPQQFQQQSQQQSQQFQPQQNEYNAPMGQGGEPYNNNYPQTMQKEVDQEMLEEKEQEVQELRETIDILEYVVVVVVVVVVVFLFCVFFWFQVQNIIN